MLWCVIIICLFYYLLFELLYCCLYCCCLHYYYLIYSGLSLWGLLNLGLISFHQFWKILGHYLFQYLFCHIFSLLSFWDFNLYMLDFSLNPTCLQYSFSVFCIIFFSLCINVDLFFSPSTSLILLRLFSHLLVNPSNAFLFTWCIFQFKISRCFFFMVSSSQVKLSAFHLFCPFFPLFQKTYNSF